MPSTKARVQIPKPPSKPPTKDYLIPSLPVDSQKKEGTPTSGNRGHHQFGPMVGVQAAGGSWLIAVSASPQGATTFCILWMARRTPP